MAKRIEGFNMNPKLALEEYKFIRKHAGKIFPIKHFNFLIHNTIPYYDNEENSKRGWILSTLTYFHIAKNMVSIDDKIIMEKDDFENLPDERILPFEKIHINKRAYYIVECNYIPWYMLEQFGGYIKEFPRSLTYDENKKP